MAVSRRLASAGDTELRTRRSARSPRPAPTGRRDPPPTIRAGPARPGTGPPSWCWTTCRSPRPRPIPSSRSPRSSIAPSRLRRSVQRSERRVRFGKARESNRRGRIGDRRASTIIVLESVTIPPVRDRTHDSSHRLGWTRGIPASRRGVRTVSGRPAIGQKSGARQPSRKGAEP